MASLSDIFNPSLLIFLGILVLVAALLVVYFETKHREQNHKINSMFSLVSSLADEVNNLKFSLAHLNSIPLNGGTLYENKPLEDEPNPSYFFNIPNPTLDQTQNLNNNLISVSDDSDSDSENSYESEFEDDLKSVETSDDNELDLNEENLLENNNNDIKVLKLNINDNDEIKSESEIEEDLDEIEDLDDVSLSSQKSSSSSQKILTLSNVIENKDLENSSNILNNSEILDISSSDLKTININLEESNTEIVDYKKLSITKLRSIAVERGFSQEITSKLKKNELLKLLGSE
jgi:hypothetical protein